ncbi:ATP-binding protein [Clostridium sp. CCUG 7971]|uniref:ATP-binding protein n=1 Tax=Clostridium sp. CCUG 7971 TaxID=2811414 RepID=UPI001ABB923B|nr:ATP-binding protein [Clostridium sp. CCUG 7971]MBO3444420.1 DUF4118 domain-containing protein [Clostridium sp. CCUG 7971]
MSITDYDEDNLDNYNYSQDIEIHNKNTIIYNLIKIALIMIASIIISFIFREVGLNEVSIILIYILGVLFSASSTDGYFYGIFASVIGVLSFNFFFTEPYYTFLAYRADYPVTFIIMLITAIIASTLTSKAKKEARISLIRENIIKLLYKNNKKLLKARNRNQVLDFCGESLVEMLKRNIMITVVDSNDNLKEPNIYIANSDGSENIFKLDLAKKATYKAFESGNPIGIGTGIYEESSSYYYPIKGQISILGVIGIASFEKEIIKENEKILLESISTQVALAIERENLFEKNKLVNLEAERERLRGNLLRSISHDLRTPLTSILGSASTIIENDEVLDNDIKKELLKNIYEDTIWLTHSFENILSMTKIDEGTLSIKKEIEVVEEIVAESIARIRKFSGNHNIKVELPDDMILIYVDGLLIEQVIVNLIQNAIRYTPENSNILVKVIKDADNVIFEVSDDGNGIPMEDINYIFDRFYTKTKSKNIEKRGIGLGLAICKSIIEAHGGKIEVSNNSSKGATFRFSIPSKGVM